MKEKSFISFDNEKLATYLWDDVNAPKGVVQIIHGMSEHAKRYDHLAKLLNSYGYIVFADDHRGHGKTADKPELVGKYNKKTNLYLDSVKDEVEISKKLKKDYPALPIFVFGHSYGSIITQKYIQDCDLQSGTILCGSSYMSTGLNKMAKIIAFLTKTFKGNNANAKLIESLSFKQYNKNIPADELWITHNKDIAKAYKDDAFCGVPFSAKFYYDLMSGAFTAYKKANLAKINKNKPLMLIAGEEDAFGGMGELVKKLYNMYDNLGIKNLSMHLYPKMRHEIHNELNNDQVFKDIKEFLDKNI